MLPCSEKDQELLHRAMLKAFPWSCPQVQHLLNTHNRWLSLEFSGGVGAHSKKRAYALCAASKATQPSKNKTTLIKKTLKLPNHLTAAISSDAISCSLGNFNFQTTLRFEVPPTLPSRGLGVISQDITFLLPPHTTSFTLKDTGLLNLPPAALLLRVTHNPATESLFPLQLSLDPPHRFG